MLARHEAVRRLRASPDDGADSSTEERFVHALADRTHDAGEFHAGDVGGPAFGSGVAARALHEVGRIDAGAADSHYDVIGTGIRGLSLLDFEVPTADAERTTAGG